MSTKVVHCKRESYDLYIGRPSKWGNPFRLEKESDRARVLQQYREWIMKQPELLAALPELRGKTLGCWCSPRACHGDVLAELSDSQDYSESLLEPESFLPTVADLTEVE